MSGSNFDKVLLDRSFKHCHGIYEKLTNLLDIVDIEKVGDINEINKKILTLSNEMYNLICIAESVKITGKKLPSSLLQKVTLNDQPKKSSSEGASISNIPKGVPQQGMFTNLMSNICNSISYTDDGYKCNFCFITVNDFEDVESHIKTEKHKNICKSPSACFNNVLTDNCSIGIFWSLAPSDLKINSIFIQPTDFTCTLCDCDLPYSLKGIYTHILGRKHLKNMPMLPQLEK